MEPFFSIRSFIRNLQCESNFVHLILLGNLRYFVASSSALQEIKLVQLPTLSKIMSTGSVVNSGQASLLVEFEEHEVPHILVLIEMDLETGRPRVLGYERQYVRGA